MLFRSPGGRRAGGAACFQVICGIGQADSLLSGIFRYRVYPVQGLQINGIDIGLCTHPQEVAVIIIEVDLVRVQVRAVDGHEELGQVSELIGGRRGAGPSGELLFDQTAVGNVDGYIVQLPDLGIRLGQKGVVELPEIFCLPLDQDVGGVVVKKDRVEEDNDQGHKKISQEKMGLQFVLHHVDRGPFRRDFSTVQVEIFWRQLVLWYNRMLENANIIKGLK